MISKLFFKPNINKDLTNYYIIIYNIIKKLPIGSCLNSNFNTNIKTTKMRHINRPTPIKKTAWTILLHFFIIKQII